MDSFFNSSFDRAFTSDLCKGSDGVRTYLGISINFLIMDVFEHGS